MKNLKPSLLIFLITSFSNADEIRTSTLKSLPDKTTKQEKAQVIQVLKDAQKSGKDDDSLDTGEISLDCKTWHKFDSKKPLPFAIENKPVFYRVSPNTMGIYTENERTLVIGDVNKLAIISVISDGFVAISPNGMPFYELKSENLLPGMAGLLQGMALFSTNPDITNTLGFMQKDGELHVVRLVRENNLNAALICKAGAGCRLTSNNKPIEIKKGSKGNALLIRTGAISDRALESIDIRCQLIEQKSFQDKVNANIQILSSACGALKNTKPQKPDFQQFAKACGQWRNQIRPSIQSLR